MLDHYAEVRQAVERLTGGEVRIDIDDAALGIPATTQRAGRAPGHALKRASPLPAYSKPYCFQLSILTS